jgi:polysaccharide deacetylase family protein (PEP-CTERM system associated)
MSYFHEKQWCIVNSDCRIVNALTFDVEDWFHGMRFAPSEWVRFEDRLRVGMDVILKLLDRYQTQATFFVLAPLAEKHPDLIRMLAAEGHEIGTHGMSHQPVYEQGRAVFSAELHQSIDILQAISGQPVIGHRAPFFSITAACRWAFDVLHAAGIQYDSSINPVRNTRYGNAAAPRTAHQLDCGLLELPIATLRWCNHNIPAGGGFYARCFPIALMRQAIYQLNALHQPAVLYFHPWEFDPQHPVIRGNISPLYRFTHYHNLHGTQRKLNTLLHDFRFGTVQQAFQQFTAVHHINF